MSDCVSEDDAPCDGIVAALSLRSADAASLSGVERWWRRCYDVLFRSAKVGSGSSDFMRDEVLTIYTTRRWSLHRISSRIPHPQSGDP
jgi:hypothetical protein